MAFFWNTLLFFSAIHLALAAVVNICNQPLFFGLAQLSAHPPAVLFCASKFPDSQCATDPIIVGATPTPARGPVVGDAPATITVSITRTTTRYLTRTICVNPNRAMPRTVAAFPTSFPFNPLSILLPFASIKLPTRPTPTTSILKNPDALLSNVLMLADSQAKAACSCIAGPRPCTTSANRLAARAVTETVTFSATSTIFRTRILCL